MEVEGGVEWKVDGGKLLIKAGVFEGSFKWGQNRSR